jgi:autotransporter-associated beta strand protein
MQVNVGIRGTRSTGKIAAGIRGVLGLLVGIGVGTTAFAGARPQWISAAGETAVAGVDWSVADLSGVGTIELNPINGVGGNLSVLQTGDTSFSGILTGAGSLGLSSASGASGTDTLTLTGANSYSGGTTVTSGVLALQGQGSLGTGSLTVNGGCVDLGGTNQAVAGLSGGVAASVVLDRSGGEGGTLTVVENAPTTFEGSLSGDGSLVVSGTAALTLTSPNTYTGGTTLLSGGLVLTGQGGLGSSAGPLVINGGVLTVSNTAGLSVGSLAGAGGSLVLDQAILTIVDPGARVAIDPQPAVLIVNQAGDTVFSGSVSGSGSLSKLGGGTLVLDGQNSYTGATTVQGGVLLVGDAQNSGATLASAQVTVDAGGELGGHGSLTGSLDNFGVVKPGGSVGTLSVGGNYTQAQGGDLVIALTPQGTSQLKVGGSASLAGNLTLLAEPGDYSGKTYTILTAAEGVSGTFSSLSGGQVGLASATLNYGADAVGLVWNVEEAPNDASIYSALQTEALVRAQERNRGLLERLDGFGAGDGADADGLSLALEAGLPGAASALDGVLPALPQALRRAGGWVKIEGDLDHLDGSGGVSGYDAQGADVLAGVDGRIGESLLVGAALGLEHTGLDQSDGESATLDVPNLAVYGQAALGALRLDATAGWAYVAASTQRRIAEIEETASANPEGQEATFGFEASLPVDALGLIWVPAVGLRYAQIVEGSSVETGAPGWDLEVADQTVRSVQPYAGLGVEKGFSLGGRSLRAGLAADFASETADLDPATQASVNGASFTIPGDPASRSRLGLSAGLDLRLGAEWALSLGDRAILPTAGLCVQSLGVALKWRFGSGAKTSASPARAVVSASDYAELTRSFLEELKNGDFEDARRTKGTLEQDETLRKVELYEEAKLEDVKLAVFDGRFADVEAMLEILRSLNPGDAAYVEEALGMMEWHQGRDQSALEHFKAAARLDSRLTYLVERTRDAQ